MIKNRLRKWLFPELCCKTEFDHKDKHTDNLVKKLQSMRNILNLMHKNAMQDITGEMNSMFFMYPVKKRIPVKIVLRELLDYLDLEIVVYKNAYGELVPKIEKKMYRYTEIIEKK